ncbi:hypothetical protein [Amphibacillus cookii]|uniref:hypothetical protein n=1 Tax=Amphibacillus cookii TaxID=767787 RepID=UPI00195D16C2|nr:hypothetical protein [Amphibacillus cookii]MBM7540206.1 Na+-transporting methylmalonyl-CoA/oxaloacetate decarboxylase gamma subunit [Amphibacillus cookii]
MSDFTLLEGIQITISSLLIVITVLMLIQLVLNLFSLVFRENTSQLQIADQSPKANDEKEQMVACLASLIMINQNQQNKNYKIHSVQRIN